MVARLVPVQALGAAHPYPLIRGGGAFLICVGTGLLLGWLLPRLWKPFAIGSGVAGLAAIGLSLVLPSLGRPSPAHLMALVGAVAVELGLIYLIVVTLRGRDERTLTLAMLFAVGLHLAIMGLAFGPLIAILGLLTSTNAGAALRFRMIPLQLAGAVDAVLKIAFGVWMFAFHPAFTYA